MDCGAFRRKVHSVLHLMLLPPFWGACGSVLTAPRLFVFRKAHRGPGVSSGFHYYAVGSVYNPVGIACWPLDRLR